jgi:hypothetical protein
MLRKRLGLIGIDCDEDDCLFWAHVGPEGSESRCAVQYFNLLDAPGRELAEWLIGLKDDQLAEAIGLRKVYPAK